MPQRSEFRATVSIEIRAFANDKQDRAIRDSAIRINEIHDASRSVMADCARVRWICIKVKPGKEAAVEKMLSKADVETLIAWMPEETVVRRGRKVTLPARAFLEEYILVHCGQTPSAIRGLINTKHVVEVLGGGLRPHVVSQTIINDIMKLYVAGKISIQPLLAVDDKVYVISGPCIFHEGKVVKTTRKAVTIEINYEGRKRDISMPLAHVRKL